MQAQAVGDGTASLARSATPSPAQALTCASLMKLKRNTPPCCARLTPSPLKSCAPPSPHSGKSGYGLTSNALTAFLPLQPVGVIGDSRTCGYVAALRAVLASDFMTADEAELPYALLKKRAAHHPRSARPSGAWRVALPAQAACDD